MTARHLSQTWDALELVRAGKKITEAAVITGLNRRTVWRIVKQHNPELIKARGKQRGIGSE